MQDTLIFFASCIIEAFIVYYFFEHIFNTKKSFSFKFSIISILYVFHFCLAYVHVIGINFITNVIIIVAFQLCCYKCKLLSAVFYSLFLTIIMSLTEVIPYLVLPISFAGYEEWSSNLFMVVATFFFSKVLYWLCILYSVHFICSKKKREEYKVNLITAVCMIFLGIISFAMVFLCLIIELNIWTEVIVIICLAALFIVNIMILWLQEYVQKQQENYYSLVLEKEQERMSDSYNELLNKQDENQKILIHDIKNHMITLNDMCNSSSDQAMKEYIQNIIELPGLKNILEYTQNKSMNIILNRYEAYCKKYGITFEMDVSRADIGFMDDTDITALFCNALDNSCEAAIHTQAPFVSLKLSPVREKAMVVSLENSCEQIPRKNTLGRFVSSKRVRGEHGLGTLSIQRVAKKYNGNVDYHFDEKANIFHTVILLYKEDFAK